MSQRSHVLLGKISMKIYVSDLIRMALIEYRDIWQSNVSLKSVKKNVESGGRIDSRLAHIGEVVTDGRRNLQNI